MRTTTIMCDLCRNEGDNQHFFVPFTATVDDPTYNIEPHQELDVCHPCLKAIRNSSDRLPDLMKELHFQ